MIKRYYTNIHNLNGGLTPSLHQVMLRHVEIAVRWTAIEFEGGGTIPSDCAEFDAPVAMGGPRDVLRAQALSMVGSGRGCDSRLGARAHYSPRRSWPAPLTSRCGVHGRPTGEGVEWGGLFSGYVARMGEES